MAADHDENENDLGGRPAYLFEAADLAAVTLDPSGADLPPTADGEPWRRVRELTLGVRDAGMVGMNPEPIIRGLLARGVHVWRRADPTRMKGTTQ